MVKDAIVASFSSHTDKVDTLTFDNGLEFAGHKEISETIGADIYFAHPYSSWVRGTNENTNGLIRQYFPKNRILRDISQEEVVAAQERLNHRPRKKLGFRTPYEVFFGVSENLVVALRS